MNAIRLFCAAACLYLPGASAAASAMLATTPACEILSQDQLDKATGHTMLPLGGTADVEHLSVCFWRAEGDGPSLELKLMAGAMLSPSGQTARDYLEQGITALEAAGQPYERLADIGDGAVLTEAPDTRFVSLAAGGDYLTIRLSGGTRDAVIAVAEAAAKKMAD